MEKPSIHLDGAPNFRDLGGYQTADGRMVRPGVLFRSGHLARLSDSDRSCLEALEIRTVVDFRREREVGIFGADALGHQVTEVPLPIPGHDDDDRVYESIRSGDFTALHDLSEASRMMVREAASQFGALLRLIAEGSNLPLVYHCIGGKDRTGVASALILTILGVPWQTVRTDYLRSNERLAGFLEEQIARLSARNTTAGDSNSESIAALRRFFVLDASYIDAARDEIQQLAGSFDAYVSDWLELSPAEIASLRGSLLV